MEIIKFPSFLYYIINIILNFIKKQQDKLDILTERSVFSFKNRVFDKESKFSFSLAKLDSNNPAKILAKSVCRIEKDKKPVVSVKETKPGDNIYIYFKKSRSR